LYSIISISVKNKLLIMPFSTIMFWFYSELS
jgi:hypothetical protein